MGFAAYKYNETGLLKKAFRRSFKRIKVEKSLRGTIIFDKEIILLWYTRLIE